MSKIVFFLRREFHLVLYPSTSLFTMSHAFKHNNGTSDPVDLSFIYDGTVEGEPGSDVYGAVIMGIFRGTVRIPKDTVYYIEPAYRFFGIKEARKIPYNSVIHKEEHIDVNPLRHRREADSESVWALNKNNDWMIHQTEARVNIHDKRIEKRTIVSARFQELSLFKTTMNAPQGS
uniref:Disintegrin and metalloproteinase domain-containing protein 10 n=1 Tax=Magallana gigas TaxID=29159 RepID=K1PEX8_MAGGI